MGMLSNEVFIMHLWVVKKIVDKRRRVLGVAAIIDSQKPKTIEIRREDLHKYTFANATISSDNKVYCDRILPIERRSELKQ